MHSYPLFHAIPFLIYFWPPFFAVVWWAFCLLGVLLFSCLFSGGVLGPVSYACYLFRPALFVLVCWVLCGLCAFFVVFCGVAGLCWPLVVVGFFVPSSVALRVFAFVVWCYFGLARVLSWLRPPPCPALPLGWSVFCWSLPPGIWLYLRRPGCHACGMECCDGLAPVFTSPHGNKGFGPVWGSALYTMLRVLFTCSSFLH